MDIRLFYVLSMIMTIKNKIRTFLAEFKCNYLYISKFEWYSGMFQALRPLAKNFVRMKFFMKETVDAYFTW